MDYDVARLVGIAANAPCIVNVANWLLRHDRPVLRPGYCSEAGRCVWSKQHTIELKEWDGSTSQKTVAPQPIEAKFSQAMLDWYDAVTR
jgi:hypothetical protein